MVKLEEIKKLDLNKAVALLLSKKDLLGQVIVVVISIMILVGLVNGYLTQRQEYRQQMEQLNSKVGLIESYKNALKTVKLFLNGLPKVLDEESFSAQISDYATQNNITILSFSPGQKRVENLSDILSAHMSLRADTYKDFLLFVKAIEESPFALRIDTVSLTTSSIEDGGIDGQMDISSVSVKK